MNEWEQDWKYDRGTVFIKLALYGVFYAAMTVAAGYLLHIGWDMYQP